MSITISAGLFGPGRARIELSDEGIRLQEPDAALIDWAEIAREARVEGGWLFRRLVLPGDRVLSWLPRWRQRFWHHFFERVQAHRRPLLEAELRRIESELRRVYPRHSRWQGLSLHARSVLTAFDGMAPDQDDPLLTRLVRIAEGDEALLARYREHFIAQQRRRYQTLFAAVERRPLTDAQQRAAIIDDDRNLVLAGAGTGKTSTLIARTAYLFASGQARPDEILLLAYGRDAAREMRERLGDRLGIDVAATTFHALCLRIITAVDGERPKVSALAAEGRALERWTAAQLEALLADGAYREALVQYCRDYRQPSLDLSAQADPQALRGALSRAGILDGLVRLLSQALRRYRAAGIETGTLERRLQGGEDPNCARATFTLLEPMLERYRQTLKSSGETDFDEMIERARQHLTQGRFRPGWRFILVDEFQDLSAPRGGLIQALLAAVPDASLFAVGDDWQSIYRFNGSDLRLTTDFTGCFGHASISALDRTFRFNNRIHEVAAGFVQRNPAQLPKSLETETRSAEPSVVLVRQNRGEEGAALERVLAAICQRAPEGASVLLLARHRFRLPDEGRLAMLARACPSLQLEAQTCHAAKGREADFVLLLGLDSGTWGFPQQQAGQPLLEALLPPREAFAHAEERRLFYVALTRARRRVYLICDRNAPSPFATELLADGYPVLIDEPE